MILTDNILTDNNKLESICGNITDQEAAQVFSCEFCEISKNTFLTEHLWATASKNQYLAVHHGRKYPYLCLSSQCLLLPLLRKLFTSRFSKFPLEI